MLRWSDGSGASARLGTRIVVSAGVGINSRGFRVWWILASAVGMSVAAAVARPLSYVVGEAVGGVLGEVPAEAAIGAVAGGGVLGGIALAQWLLLRRWVSWARLWPVAGALAGAHAAAAAFVAFKAFSLAGHDGWGAGVAVAAGLGAFLAAHWLVLRRQVPAGRIGAASAGGFLLAAIVTAAVAALSGVEEASPLFGALFGAVYGAATVIALGKLLRSPA